MKSILRLLGTAKSLWPFYVTVSVFSVVLSLSSLLWPILTGAAVDQIRLGADADMGKVVLLVFLIFLQDLGSTVFDNIGGYIGDVMSMRLKRILSERYYSHLMSLPQSYFDSELSGKIIGRMTRSIEQIRSYVQMMSNNFMQFILGTVFSLVAVALISWPTALMLFALYPIFIFMSVKTSNRWMKYQEKINGHLDLANGRFVEAVNQIKVVKSFLRERSELNYFTRQVKKAEKIIKPQSRYWHEQDTLRRGIVSIFFFGVYMFIFVSAARGAFTPGQAVTLLLLAFNIRMPIFTIGFLVENTQKAVADSRDYFEIMDTIPDIQDKSDAKTLKVKRGEIEFSNVKFGYDGGEGVLKGLSFSIKPGSRVALVGESGEGKTTITNLLMRLYELNDGQISIDDQDILDVTQKSLRENIGVVFQEPALFSGTIRDNITYGNPSASDEAVRAAAKAANAHEFIENFELGYDTEIGERGLKLSGGQKQRIAIARALLKDAPILVLDEATSSLDNRSEVLVQEALENLMAGRTTIIIAHRLSTIQNVDTIVTLKSGRVDEVGSPKELEKSGGIYSRLLELSSHRGDPNTKKELKAFELS